MRRQLPLGASNGFTLLELMAVAVIVSIIAATAIPAYLDYTLRAEVLDSINVSATAKKKVNDYYQYTGRFPANNQAAGLPVPEKIRSARVSRVEIKNGVIHVTFSDTLEQRQLAGKVVSFRPVVVKNSPSSPLHFKCGYGDYEGDSDSYNQKMDDVFVIFGKNSTNVNKRLLPASCR
ncbi:pilin [Ostreibacterium oceani]|uniref:Prepilin-type N-terminal cleavage/methylation domain-containing protein n=1 Tax=Ostreibacterium oceani TaxID=2654998 RepID=A0A6N7EYI3_9GAMM|nr:pilin [Ostreibacterium oceani]MPV85538.1 prepilin-type N-terminal cleavage/methylation domain-containing protein [Ostreibacterium oceani]